jgi:hypothetical protein
VCAGQPRRQLQPAAHAAEPRQQRPRVVEAGRLRHGRRHQHVVGLKPPRQRQQRLVPRAVLFQLQQLPLGSRQHADQPHRVAALAHHAQIEPPRAGDVRQRPQRGGIQRRARDHRAAVAQQLREQPQLRRPVAVHRAVIVQVVAGQVGERRDREAQAVQPALVEPV